MFKILLSVNLINFVKTTQMRMKKNYVHMQKLWKNTKRLGHALANLQIINLPLATPLTEEEVCEVKKTVEMEERYIPAVRTKSPDATIFL